MNGFFVTAVAVVLFGLPRTAKAACPENADTAQCRRVNEALTRWNSTALFAVPIAVVEEPGCAYDQENGRVEISRASFSLSEGEFAECVSRAFAQARFEAVESTWTAEIDAREAWVIKGGAFEKVAVPGKSGGKLAPAFSRDVWVGLAARELARELGASGRTLASTGTTTAVHKNVGFVRRLLGLR